MVKTRYENEAALKSYIENIIRFRSKEQATAYINSKIEQFSFSPDFADWISEQLKQLNEPFTNIETHNLSVEQPLAPCPEISFGSLNQTQELAHLKAVKKHAKYSEKETFIAIDKTMEEMQDLRHSIRYAPVDDKPDLIDLSVQLSHRREDLQHKNRLVCNAIRQPYFGRFDINNHVTQKSFYISKTNISNYVDNHHNVHFIDWRAPIADLFYRYQTPSRIIDNQKISGDLKLTARFTIKNGTLTNITYSAQDGDNRVKNVTNEILQEKLQSNSSEQMTEIVETIQPEQNAIVRHDPNANMIIQGVAGSGKTAVALHRIAYLVYHQPELRKSGICFISPNEVFTRYVSNVLPELGEFNIPIKTFEDITNDILEKSNKKQKTQNVETLKEFIEKYYQTNTKDKNISKKFTKKFNNKFHQLCKTIEKDGQKRREYQQTLEDAKIAHSNVKHQENQIDIYENAIKGHWDGRNHSKLTEREARAALPLAKLELKKLKQHKKNTR